MRLIMPRAGVDPGRAARAGAIVPNETGANIARLGDIAATVGVALENDRRDRNFQRAQVELTREVNDLRLNVEQIGDPDRADATFQQGVQALRQRYLEDRGDDPVLDPANRDRFGIAFDRLVNATAFQVGARNLELRQSERRATYDAHLAEAVRAAASADPDTRNVMLSQLDENVASLLESGAVTPEQAQALLQGQRAEMVSAPALQALNDDPADFLDRAEAGEFDALDPDTLVRLRASAVNDLRVAADRAQKEAEKAQREMITRTGNELDRISSLSDTRRMTPEDRAFLDSEDLARRAESDPDLMVKWRKAQARVSLDEDEAVYAAMTPAQLDAAIAEERARTVEHPFQEERLALLIETRDRVAKAIEEDPLTHAASLGLTIPELPFDQGPEAFEAGLAARVATGRALQTQGFARDLVVMTPEERAALKPSLAPGADPSDRFTIINGMARQLGRDADRAILRATGDRVTAHAATLVANGTPRAEVEALLTAQKRVADGTVTTPSPAAWRESFADLTGGMFVAQPETQARLQDAALALYAQDNPVEDSGTIDDTAAKVALSRALGGDGGDRGGIMEIDPAGFGNSYNLPLPPGVSHRLVADTLEVLPDRLSRRVDLDAEGRVTGDLSPADLSVLQAAGLRGAPPDFRGAAPARAIESLTLAPLWPDGRPVDQYVFMSAKGAPLLDTNGKVYVFSLRRLMREVRP